MIDAEILAFITAFSKSSIFIIVLAARFCTSPKLSLRANSSAMSAKPSLFTAYSAFHFSIFSYLLHIILPTVAKDLHRLVFRQVGGEMKIRKHENCHN